MVADDGVELSSSLAKFVCGKYVQLGSRKEDLRILGRSFHIRKSCPNAMHLFRGCSHKISLSSPLDFYATTAEQ